MLVSTAYIFQNQVPCAEIIKVAGKNISFNDRKPKSAQHHSLETL